MQPTIIGILGKPLSGKDTVANALCDHFPDVTTISMGDVVREVKATGPSHRFWSLLKDSISVVDRGGIAPDAPIFTCLTQLIEERLKQGYTTVVWVAGPRSDQQLGWLDNWTRDRGYGEQFLYVDVPDAEVYRRVRTRADGRPDDREDIINFRLKEFERVTKPGIDRLRQEGRLMEINGIGGKEGVAHRAIESLMMTARDPEITLPIMARR